MKLLSLALNSVGDSAWWLSLLFSYLFPVAVVISCSNYSHRHRVTEVNAQSKITSQTIFRRELLARLYAPPLLSK